MSDELRDEGAVLRKRWPALFAVALVVIGVVLLLRGLIEELPAGQEPNITPAKISESTSSASLGVSGEKVLVARVIDGDTIEIEGGQKVRYIGIDTPETVDPRRAVGCFGKEASDENKRLVEGKNVLLVKDVSDTDKFGRLLRYVYINTDNGSAIFVNDHLVRQGFARASTYPPDVKFTDRFLQAEREAREGNRGLWQKCN